MDSLTPPPPQSSWKASTSRTMIECPPEKRKSCKAAGRQGRGACCGSLSSDADLLPSRAPEPPPPASPSPSAGLRAWAEMLVPQLAALCSVPRAGDLRGPGGCGVSAAVEACCQACSGCNSHASPPPADLEVHPLAGSSGSVGVSAPGCACAGCAGPKGDTYLASAPRSPS